MASKITGSGLAYSDVLIRPNLSDIRSRHSDQLDTSTIIARGLPPIKLPIISANMDTVTEHRMAITMALYGGLGVIHRFMTSEEQAFQVKLVKDMIRIIEDDPPLVPATATLLVIALQQNGTADTSFIPENILTAILWNRRISRLSDRPSHAPISV
jgi:IMP dehydrogenase